MSTIEMIIEERATSIGNFLVGRLLPFREKWIAQNFPKIKGEENEFVPYPSRIKK